MKKRTVHVKKIAGNSAAFSSIISIGDTGIANPKSKEMAIQEEGAIFTDKDDVPFSAYELFTRPAKWPTGINNVSKYTINQYPHIHVNRISFNGASTSSIIQVGSIDRIRAEARIKHFRILEPS